MIRIGRILLTSLLRIEWTGLTLMSAKEYGVDLPDMEDIGLPKAVDATVMIVGEVASPGMSVRNCRVIHFRRRTWCLRNRWRTFSLWGATSL